MPAVRLQYKARGRCVPEVARWSKWLHLFKTRRIKSLSSGDLTEEKRIPLEYLTDLLLLRTVLLCETHRPSFTYYIPYLTTIAIEEQRLEYRKHLHETLPRDNGIKLYSRGNSVPHTASYTFLNRGVEIDFHMHVYTRRRHRRQHLICMHAARAHSSSLIRSCLVSETFRWEGATSTLLGPGEEQQVRTLQEPAHFGKNSGAR